MTATPQIKLSVPFLSELPFGGKSLTLPVRMFGRFVWD